MKRLSCLFTAFFLLVLTACGANRNPFSGAVPPTVPAHFSSDMRIVGDGGEMTARITRDLSGVTEITLSSPEELKGLSLRFGSDSGSISYGSLSLEIDYSGFPDAAVFKLLLETLKRLDADATVTVDKTGTGWRYTLSDGESEKITVLQNGDTGFIDSVTIPSRSLSVTFSNFSELTEEATQ